MLLPADPAAPKTDITAQDAFDSGCCSRRCRERGQFSQHRLGEGTCTLRHMWMLHRDQDWIAWDSEPDCWTLTMWLLWVSGPLHMQWQRNTRGQESRWCPLKKSLWCTSLFPQTELMGSWIYLWQKQLQRFDTTLGAGNSVQPEMTQLLSLYQSQVSFLFYY